MLQKLNKKISRNQKGFSLIELMVAVAILAMAAFGIFQAFSAGFQSITDAKYITIATNLAQEKIENMKNTNYYTNNTETVSVDGKEFIVENFEYPDNPYPGINKIEVIVTWNKRNEGTSEVTLDTLIYNLPEAS